MLSRLVGWSFVTVQITNHDAAELKLIFYVSCISIRKKKKKLDLLTSSSWAFAFQNYNKHILFFKPKRKGREDPLYLGSGTYLLPGSCFLLPKSPMSTVILSSSTETPCLTKSLSYCPKGYTQISGLGVPQMYFWGLYYLLKCPQFILNYKKAGKICLFSLQSTLSQSILNNKDSAYFLCH